MVSRLSKWAFSFAVVPLAFAAPALAHTNPTDWSQPFTSPASVMRAYRSKAKLIGPRDPRGIFHRIYIEVSAEVDRMIRNHEFKNERWMSDVMVSFANLYREAIHESETGSDDLPPAWFAADWEYKRVPPQLPLIQLLAAINAHINRDLPLALVRAHTDFSREDLKEDYHALSRAFYRPMPKLWAILEDYEHCHHPKWEKTLVMKAVDSLLISTRDDAWNKGRELSSIRDPGKYKHALFEHEKFAVDQYFRLLTSVVPKLDPFICRPDPGKP